MLRVLDERGQVDPTIDAAGESARTVRDKLETAASLESLPEIAAAAYEGALSSEQFARGHEAGRRGLAMREWARRAPNVAPVELARLARNAVKPSTEDSRARYKARSLRMWWTHGQRDVAPAWPVARRAGCHVRSHDPAAHRPAQAGEGSGVGQLRTPRRRRPRATVRPTRREDETPTMAPGRWCRHWSRCRARRRSPGYPSPTPCWNSCAPTPPSNRCWSTTTAPRSRSGNASCPVPQDRAGGAAARSRLSALRPPPRTPDPPPPTPLLGRHRRHLRPGRGVHHLPPRPRPPRPLRPRRQPQPARRPPQGPPRRPHPPTTPTIGLPPRRAGPHAA